MWKVSADKLIALYTTHLTISIYLTRKYQFTCSLLIDMNPISHSQVQHRHLQNLYLYHCIQFSQITEIV